MGGGELAWQRHGDRRARQRQPRRQTRRQNRYYVTSLRTGAKALLRHGRDRGSIENSWHWPRVTQLKEDAHRYREANGVQIMATLRSLAKNALRLDGFWSITGGLAGLGHDIRGMQELLGWREAVQPQASG